MACRFLRDGQCRHQGAQGAERDAHQNVVAEIGGAPGGHVGRHESLRSCPKGLACDASFRRGFRPLAPVVMAQGFAPSDAHVGSPEAGVAQTMIVNMKQSLDVAKYFW